jgi:hypothetical protein
MIMLMFKIPEMMGKLVVFYDQQRAYISCISLVSSGLCVAIYILVHLLRPYDQSTC